MTNNTTWYGPRSTGDGGRSLAAALGVDAYVKGFVQTYPVPACNNCGVGMVKMKDPNNDIWMCIQVPCRIGRSYR